MFRIVGMKQDNQQQQNQAFGTQQLLSNQVPDVKMQSNQRFVTQPQSWQGKDSSFHYLTYSSLIQ